MIIKILRKAKRTLWSSLAAWMRLRYKLPSGVVIWIDSYSDWCTIGDIFMNGEYDQAIDYSLLNSIKSNDFVFLDLGANVGFFTHRLLHRASWYDMSFSNFKGLLVEATPSLKPELERRLTSCKSLGAELKILTAAVGAKSGFASMMEGRAHSRNFLSNNETTSGWKVPFVDLEKEDIGKRTIDLIKCDIEGAEVLFLKEYPDLLRRTKVLVIECHPPVCTENSAKESLAALGFEFKGRLRNDPEGITLWFQNASANHS